MLHLQHGRWRKRSFISFALKLIWRLFTQHTSLWVSWVKYYLLKNNSFWDVRDTQKGSWMWRKLFKLRDVAYGFFRMEVKDGKSTYFWFNNWLGKGRLIDIIGAAGTTYIGLPHCQRCSEVECLVHPRSEESLLPWSLRCHYCRTRPWFSEWE